MTDPTLEELKDKWDAANRAWYDAYSRCPPAVWDEYQAIYLAVYKAEAAYRKALKAQKNSDA